MTLDSQVEIPQPSLRWNGSNDTECVFPTHGAIQVIGASHETLQSAPAVPGAGAQKRSRSSGSSGSDLSGRAAQRTKLTSGDKYDYLLRLLQRHSLILHSMSRFSEAMLE